MNRPLVAVLALAAAARAFRVGHESLWLDEGFTFERVTAPSLSDVILHPDVHPPLYALLLRFWIRIVGTSEAGLRSFSAVLGVLAVLAAHRLALRLFDRRTALATAVLIALNTFQLHYSQEARSYSLLAAETALSFLFFLDVIQRPTRRAYVLFAVASVVALYTHLFAVLTILAQNAFYFLHWLRNKNRRAFDVGPWMACQLAVALTFLPWLIVLARQASVIDGNFWIGRPTLATLVDTFRGFAGGTALLAAFTAAAVAVAVRTLRTGDARSGASIAILVLWLSIGVGVPFVFSLVSTPIFVPRYVIGSSLAFAILAAHGLASLRTGWARAVVAGAVAILSAGSLFDYYAHPRNEQWREAVGHVSSEAWAGDLLVLHPHKCLGVLSYYFQRTDVDLLAFPKPGELAHGIEREKSNWVTDERAAELEAAVRNRPRVWVVVSHSRDKERRIERVLAQSHRLAEEKQYLDVRLERFDLP